MPGGSHAPRGSAEAPRSLLLSFVLCVACSGSGCDDAQKPQGAGGTLAADSGGGAGGTTAGRGGSGGSSGAGGVGGGGGRGGSSGSTGGAGDAAGGTSGTGGGLDGAAGSGGATGPSPSAGCGRSNPATGERRLQVAAKTGLYIVSVPSIYDPMRPYPLGFAFHGRNRNHTNCQSVDCAGFQSELGSNHVLVYMQSLRVPVDNATGGWESAQEREENVQFFQQVLAVLKAEYCIDQRRIFVAGTSSGASFSNLLACRFGDQLLAAGPVSGSMPETANCRGTPAAVVIHGIDDPHVTFASGEAARDFYVRRSGCSTTTTPALATMHADIRAKRDAMQETHGCVDYAGCNAAAPVRWCEHSYGGYDNSTHGWPPNGGRLIREFVQALR